MSLGALPAFDTASAAAGEIDRLRQAARRAPKDVRVKTALGDALATAGRDREAEKAYREALRLDPRPLPTKTKLAGALVRLGRHGEAERLILKLFAVPAAEMPPRDVAELLAEMLVQVWAKPGEATLAEGLARLQARIKAPEPLLLVAERLSAQSAHGAAVEACNLSLDRWPDSAPAFAGLGAALLAAGDADNAVLAAKRAVELDLSRRDARLVLVQALIERSEYAPAEAVLQEALLLDVNDVEVLGTYANLLFGLHRNGEALALLDRALGVAPGVANLHRLRSALLARLDRGDEAVAAAERAVELAPRDPAQRVAKAECLLQLDRIDEAEAVLSAALGLAPDDVPTLSMLGRLHNQRGAYDRAEAVLRRAVELQPRRPHAWNTLGMVHNACGRYAQALEAFEAAERAGPMTPGALYNKAFALLALGDLSAGWQHYQVGIHAGERPAWRRPGRPLWEGEPLAGRRIGLLAEQGVGDQVLFLSCLDDFRALPELQGAEIELEVTPKLAPLIARSFPDLTVHPAEKDLDLVRAIDARLDVCLPMASLPVFTRPTVESFAGTRAFLGPDPGRVDHWRARLAELAPGPVVGLCWRSMNMATARRNQYLRVEDLPPLMAEPSVSFVSLQYGDAAQERAWLAEATGGRLLSLDDELDMTDELDEVAALMAALDAVVAPKSTVAWMAAALGRPTLVFGRRAGFWHMLGTERLPFLPAVELFTVDADRRVVEAVPAMARRVGELTRWTGS